MMIAPGETKTVCFELDKRSFAEYKPEISGWYAATGEYTILAGGSSDNLPLQVKVYVESTDTIPLVYNDYTTIGDLWDSGLDVNEVLDALDAKQTDLSLSLIHI